MNTVKTYREFFSALHEGSIEKLAETASKLLDMPIVVSNTTFVIIAKYPLDLFGDDQWDANYTNRQIQPEYIKIFQQDKHWDALKANEGHAVLINWGHFATSPRYSVEIKSKGKTFGYAAALIGDKEPEDWHIETMDVFAEALSIALANQSRTKRENNLMAGVALQGLLMDEFEDEEEFSQLSSMTGDLFEPNYVLAAIRTCNPLETSLEEYLGEIFSNHLLNSLHVVQDGLLYVLLSRIEQDFREKSYFKQALHQLKEADAICAFSRIFSDLLSVVDYKWQVDKLLEVGSNLRPDKTVFHFDDYALPIIISVITTEISATNMIHPALFMLIHYDSVHNTEYFETLRAYTLSCFNKSSAYEVLNIHRNTLAYRLKKIEEIVGIRFSEGDFGISLFLSFRYIDLNKIDLKKIAHDYL